MAQPALVNDRMLAIGAMLVALVVANLGMNVCLFWLAEVGPRSGRYWISQAAIGNLIAQVMFLGLWLGLGDRRWYLRLVVAIALTLCTAMTIAWAGALSRRSRWQMNQEPWAMIAFILIAMMLAVSVPALVLRRTRTWRLTWQQNVTLRATQQFQVGDVLLWMIPISGALAAVRFVMSLDGSFGSQMLEISLITLRTAAVVLAAMLAAFATRSLIRALILLPLVVLLIGGIFAVPEMYQIINRIGGGGGPVTMRRYVVSLIEEGTRQEVFAFAAMFCGLANCSAFRLLGCQLVRPGTIALAKRTQR